MISTDDATAIHIVKTIAQARLKDRVQVTGQGEQGMAQTTATAKPADAGIPNSELRAALAVACGDSTTPVSNVSEDLIT